MKDSGGSSPDPSADDGPGQHDVRPAPLADRAAELPEELRPGYDELRREYLRLHSVAFNGQTGLPAHGALTTELSELLQQERTVGVVLLSLLDVAQIERALGWREVDSILTRVARVVRERVAERFGERALLAQDGVAGERFLAFVPWSAATGQEELGMLERLAGALREDVERALVAASGEGALLPRVAAGFSVLFADESMRFQRLVDRAATEAGAMLRSAKEKAHLRNRMELRELLAERRLQVAWQPIISFATAEIMGIEALCRGPAGSTFETAEHLFSTGQAQDLAHELDVACCERIFSSVPVLAEDRLLFVNILPESILDARFDAAGLASSVRSAGLEPSRVVLEIAERGRIPGYAGFRRRLEPLREDGFKIAVDDVGTGYASLRLLPEVEPDLLKVDASLVRDIDLHPTKQGVMGTILDMAGRLGAEVVCEGIENARELETCMRLGAHHGQGYHLLPPAPVVRESFGGPSALARRLP